jgi:N-formylglutamate amidohydrolase
MTLKENLLSYPFTLLQPMCAPTPLIVDSPHSGRVYPDDFDFECSLDMLRQTEDSYVDQLVVSATQGGATVIMAEFARSYIDVNRAEDDIDPALLAAPWPTPLNPCERTLQGLGLVRRFCKSNLPVYSKPLPVAEVQKRIADYYRPYHAALTQAVGGRMAQFGECYLVDCHSMPGQGSEHGVRRPDFVLGDRQGESCDPSFTRRVRDILQEMGYSVALNDPYKGMEIVRRYGQPRKGQHALQLEINRRLYLNEQTLEKHVGFARLAADLAEFFQTLAAELMRQMPMAAE